MLSNDMIKIWKVEEANEFINDKVRKIKYEGEERTLSNRKLYKYNVILNDNTLDMMFVDDIVTMDINKVIH